MWVRKPRPPSTQGDVGAVLGCAEALYCVCAVSIRASNAVGGNCLQNLKTKNSYGQITEVGWPYQFNLDLFGSEISFRKVKNTSTRTAKSEGGCVNTVSPNNIVLASIRGHGVWMGAPYVDRAAAKGRVQGVLTKMRANLSKSQAKLHYSTP